MIIKVSNVKIVRGASTSKKILHDVHNVASVDSTVSIGVTAILGVSTRTDNKDQD